ncbi:uncharacterized protein LOC143291464 [Babylonia areolata]|uniref:uncharacterized protein LOC143291464 n=1 Tax=Babylonia areolata TaxID=304850 RepID=UPI003FD0D2F0
MTGWVACCLLGGSLLLISVSLGAGDSQCGAQFHFPTVDVHQDYHYNTTTKTITTSTPTTIYFQIVSNCPESLNVYSLNVDAYDGRSTDGGLGDGKLFCSLRSFGEVSGNCGCDAAGSGSSCHATETFPRRPYRTWKLTDLYRRIASKTVVFNVTYPTILEHLHLTHHEDRSSVTVNKGDTIQFECQWSEGNPQRRVLLLGPDNSTLKEVDVTDGRRSSMRHAMKIISCSDGGQYRCQVEGTEEVKSFTVLVGCPLTFKEPAVFPTKHVVSGEDATFSFRATSYTHNVRSCQLKKPDDTTIGCNSSSSVVTVTGPLPDVDVIVTLKDVTERDEGTWQLTVSNPTPSQENATAFFNVSVPNFNANPDRAYFWKTIGGGSVLLVIIITVIIIVRMRKNRRNLPRATGTAGDDHSAVPVACSDDYLEPVARRVDSAGDEYVEVIPHNPNPPHRVPPPVPPEEHDYIEMTPATRRRVPPPVAPEEHDYIEMTPATRRRVPPPVAPEEHDYIEMTPATRRRLPPPVAAEGPYDDLTVDEIEHTALYSKLGSSHPQN